MINAPAARLLVATSSYGEQVATDWKEEKSRSLATNENTFIAEWAEETSLKPLQKSEKAAPKKRQIILN
jgi:hypothetical protein